MAEWPQSSQELFGIGTRFGARELKKAYSKLIRFYKPEHYPSEFARIREAYEYLLHWASDDKIESSEELPLPLNVINDEPRLETQSELHAPNELQESDRKGGIRQNPKAHSDANWKLAGHGELNKAYLGLVAGTKDHPSFDLNYLRLFWLICTHPELEKERYPAHWLMKGISESGGSLRLYEAYTTYLTMLPEAAISDRVKEVLDKVTDDHLYAHIVRVSWKQLLKNRRWRQVEDFIPQVRSRLVGNPEAWLGLLRIIADRAGWETVSLSARDLMRACVKEYDDLQDFSLDYPEAFDHLDFLRLIVKSSLVAESGNGFQKLVDVIRREWCGSLDDVRVELHEVLANIAKFPNKWANRFDEAGPGTFPIACVAYQLAMRLRIESEQPDRAILDDDRTRNEIRREFKSLNSYYRFRDDLSKYCYRSFYAPEDLARFLGARYASTHPHQEPLIDQLLQDWPVRLICLAHRLYHS